MDIVFICDRNYLMPTRVAINSVIENKSCEDNICIYVIGVSLSIDDFAPIMRLQSEQVCIKPIIAGHDFEQISIKHQHVSKAALYKFLIPELIECDKVLYLDSDVLVLDSLRDLYKTNLEDMYAAVVVDISAELERQYHLKRSVSHYFNSGMMLLNLEELRKQKISQKLIAVRQADTANLFMDQDTFNKVFNNKIVLVSVKYNLIPAWFEQYKYSSETIAEFYNLDIAEAKKCVEQPVIFHLADKKKPWSSGDIRNQYIWYQYAFKEDFPQIIQSIVEYWKVKNKALESRLEYQKKNEKMKMAQQEENILFYKNSMQFVIEEQHLSGVMEEVWGVKNEILKFLSKWERKQQILIYGAGRMAWAVFKTLWYLNYIEQVAGFVVSNGDENVGELYGKQVLTWESCKNRSVVIIIAIKNISDKEIEKIRNRGFQDILEVKNLICAEDGIWI